jgi:hypothetical protein
MLYTTLTTIAVVFLTTWEILLLFKFHAVIGRGHGVKPEVTFYAVLFAACLSQICFVLGFLYS